MRNRSERETKKATHEQYYQLEHEPRMMQFLEKILGTQKIGTWNLDLIFVGVLPQLTSRMVRFRMR